jgi:hypothetical protein
MVSNQKSYDFNSKNVRNSGCVMSSSIYLNLKILEKTIDFLFLTYSIKGVFMKKSIIVLMGSILFLMMFCGCTGTSVRKESAAAQTTNVANTSTVNNQYYDFSDVLIPGELKLKPKLSSVYRTPGFAAGLLVFEGRYDATSLSGFFESNMAKDNWRSKASIKFNPMILIFEKDNRICVIRIKENTFYTHVEVWMAPATKESVSTIFN